MGESPGCGRNVGVEFRITTVSVRAAWWRSLDARGNHRLEKSTRTSQAFVFRVTVWKNSKRLDGICVNGSSLRRIPVWISLEIGLRRYGNSVSTSVYSACIAYVYFNNVCFFVNIHIEINHLFLSLPRKKRQFPRNLQIYIVCYTRRSSTINWFNWFLPSTFSTILNSPHVINWLTGIYITLQKRDVKSTFRR